jgi:hypothetical protein
MSFYFRELIYVSKVLDIGFVDPGLNETLNHSDDMIRNSLTELKQMNPHDRVMLLVLLGIGDRVDRLIGMVKLLEKP